MKRLPLKDQVLQILEERLIFDIAGKTFDISAYPESFDACQLFFHASPYA